MQPDLPNPDDPEQVPHRKARRSRHRCPNGEVAITYRILVIGYGGWTLHAEDLEKGHYGDTWVLYVGEMADDIIGVDLTAIPRTDPRLSRLALDGPMVKVGVPAGTLDTCHGPETFVDNGDLGNARAFITSTHRRTRCSPNASAPGPSTREKPPGSSPRTRPATNARHTGHNPNRGLNDEQTPELPKL